MGSRFLNWGNVPIPDVLVMHKSYRKPDVRLYEVKASRSDLQKDCRAGKWERYLPFCDRLYFALGPDVGEWESMLGHQNVGVMVRGKNGWKTVRAAPKNPHRQPFQEEVLLALIFTRLSDPRDSRLQRLEAERERLAKDAIRELTQTRNRELKKFQAELNEREHELRLRSERLGREAIEALRKKLDLKSQDRWREQTLDQLLREALLDPVRDICFKAQAEVSKNFDKVLELLKEEEKKETE